MSNERAGGGRDLAIGEFLAFETGKKSNKGGREKKKKVNCCFQW